MLISLSAPWIRGLVGLVLCGSLAYGQPSVPRIGETVPSPAPAGGWMNFSTLAAAPQPSPAPRLHRHGRISTAGRTGPTSIGSPLPPPLKPAVPPHPPAVNQSFQGLDDNGASVPPDTMGAVGPNHVFTTLNTQYLARSKAGVVSGSPVSIDAFWSVTGRSGNFDPRVLYDPGSQRWLVAAASSAPNLTNSYVMIGASATNDPTGTWKLCAVSFDPNNTIWADFPILGYDGTRVVLTVNIFPVGGQSSQGSRVYIWTKSDLINMATTCANTVPRIRSTTSQAAAMAPATSYDAGSTTMYLVEDWNGNPGTGPGQLRLSSITGALGSETFNEGIGFVSAPAGVTWTYAGDPVGFTDFAPQLGSPAKIDTGDSRIGNCILRFSSLWCTQNAFIPASGPTRSDVQWWQIDPSAFAYQQFGRLDDPSGVKFYAYGSIAVNKNKDVLIGYSRFGADQYASGNWAFRYGTDTANALTAVDQVVQAGKAPYNKTFGGPNNRWGDYSAANVDPADDLTMWTLQEYADTPLAPNDRFGVWWTSVSPNSASGVQITISSNTSGVAVSVDNGAAQPVPLVLNLTPGTSHTFQWATPQSGPAGTQYVFTGWQDGSALNPRPITVPGVPATYQGNFKTQYLLTMNAGANGVVTPPTGYFDQSSVVPIQATPNTGFTFSGWTGVGTGSYTGPNASTTVTMNGPITQTAAFAAGSGGFTAIRVRAGSPINYVDPLGQLWSRDTQCTGAMKPFSSGAPIANTATPALYQSECFASTGNLTYTFANIPPGIYNVRLKWAEIYFSSPGQRSFSVQANAAAVLSNFDIVAMAGASNAAVDQAFRVTLAATGPLTITLVPQVSLPKLSALEITAAATDVTVTPAVATPTGPVQFTANVLGGGGVNWTLSPLGFGAISPSGLYSPPNGGFSTGQRVTVTATSVSNPAKSASSTITLLGPWGTIDIGSVNQPGSFSQASGALTVTGAGDLNGTADAFRFVYQPLAGDASITARFNSPTPCCTSPTKAGVMFRGGTAPGDVHAFMSIYSSIVGLLESRGTTSATTSVAFGGAGVFWVKLIRRGNTFNAFISAEGNSWIPVGAPVTIAGAPSTMLVGFAVSSGLTPAFTAIFDNVTISSTTSVDVDQRLVTLAAGQSAQFSASVIGAASSAVNWSVTAGQGTITPAGLYTAPGTITNPTQQTATVTAVSQADPAKSSSVSVVLNASLVGPVRVNAGGPAHIDPNSVFWNADTGSTVGNVYSSGSPISNTTTPYLYQTERFTSNAPLTYGFYVPTGPTYTVTLKFAEIFFTTAGQRPMAVQINGVTLQPSFDPFTAAGAANTAVDLSFPGITPVNGQITVTLAPVNSSAPKISAIQITSP